MFEYFRIYYKLMTLEHMKKKIIKERMVIDDEIHSYCGFNYPDEYGYTKCCDFLKCSCGSEFENE